MRVHVHVHVHVRAVSLGGVYRARMVLNVWVTRPRVRLETLQLNEVPAVDLVSALASCTIAEAQQLESTTAQLDIGRDATELRYVSCCCLDNPLLHGTHTHCQSPPCSFKLVFSIQSPC